MLHNPDGFQIHVCTKRTENKMDHDTAAIVSDTCMGGESHDDDNSSNEGEKMLQNDEGDELYDAGMDDEDEAYVYRNLRGGVEEPIQVARVRRDPRSDNRDVNAQELRLIEEMNILKPRDSDAILSCPCCLNVVCMDCQKHEHYKNQYRAMFVMNIGVQWNRRYKHDKERNELVEFDDAGVTQVIGLSNEAERSRENVAAVAVECDCEDNHPAALNDKEDDIFYAVHCATCFTDVAVLNMKDELYHFTGCVASTG